MKILRRGAVSRVTDSFFSYQAWPSVCVDENGVIYAVCSGFRMGHMCPFGKIVMYKSRDGGKTFSLPVVVADHFLDDRDSGILYLGNGRMLVNYCFHPAKTYLEDFADWIYSDSGEAGAGMLRCYNDVPESQRAGGCFYKILDNYGETAGEEKRLPVHAPHGPVMLKDGTIFYLGKEIFTGDPDRDGRFSVYTSKNGGESFEKLSDCEVPDGYGRDTFHEPYCAQLPDGRIMAAFRSHLTDNDDYFTIMVTFSSDGGVTWSDWQKTGICGSPPHLLTLRDGRTVLTYGRRVPPYGIYGRMITPEGVITEDEFMLAECPDDDIGYPATAELPDGSLFTAYYSKYGSDKTTSILSVKWLPDPAGGA